MAATRSYYVSTNRDFTIYDEVCITSGAAVRFLVSEGLEYNAAEALVDLAYVHPGEDIVLRVGNDEYSISLK